MNRTDEINLEIRNLALRNIDKCVALFELPLVIYNQIMIDNATRKNPYKVSENRIKKVIAEMKEFD